jgi:hypothetical protein
MEIRRKDEVEYIIKGEKIVRLIKWKRIKWIGKIERMKETAIKKNF